MIAPADPFREWDVAYVLGSLSPADRLAYERHLVRCPSCEAEVCRAAGTAGLLARLPAAWAVSPSMQGAVNPVVEPPARARAARRRLVVVTAVLVAAVTGAALSAVFCG
ncbi:Putative zinc-finger [Lentzea xinjiangensis]|uniref:Putative zinc-finger n=1 Tax=Lentzea xinjiangensis TaxID=402600 RepID=A0A1H9VEQ9_9PSEU|nr:zf-HC2 domain-containing protein [Lentzea xinjiangensis]SES20185.1 Putative zinc-finger [Lentzea xinjiangensis]